MLLTLPNFYLSNKRKKAIKQEIQKTIFCVINNYLSVTEESFGFLNFRASEKE